MSRPVALRDDKIKSLRGTFTRTKKSGFKKFTVHQDRGRITRTCPWCWPLPASTHKKIFDTFLHD